MFLVFSLPVEKDCDRHIGTDENRQGCVPHTVGGQQKEFLENAELGQDA